MNSEATITLAEEVEVQSCFLPETKVQFAWDSTSLGYLKTCPRLYQYIMIEGYSPKEDSVHLRFGQEYHKALEDYDRLRFAGVDRDEAIRTVIAELLVRVVDWHPDPSTKAGRYKSVDNLVSLVIDYLDHYKDDPAETYELKDGVPAVELSFRFELDWGPNSLAALRLEHPVDIPFSQSQADLISQPYLLSGHLDRVVKFGDDLFVMDRKTTTTTLGEYYFDQFEPNNQMTLYTLASQIVLASPIRGVIIDGAQILLEKPHSFKRGFTFRTPDQVNEWANDLRYWLSLAEQYANADYWPMNDTACDKFGGCKFRGICSKSPQVRDQFLKSGFTKLDPEHRWNPLKPRGPE